VIYLIIWALYCSRPNREQAIRPLKDSSSTSLTVIKTNHYQ
jgi:hypothetical protein